VYLSQESIGVENNQIKGNDRLINELEVLNQPSYIWPLMDSKNRNVIRSEAFH
jgi:hypothetical protein